MSFESNVQTAEDFVRTWDSSSQGIKTDGVVSFYKETHHQVDSYPFFSDQGGFYVIDKTRQVENQKVYVESIIEKESYIGAAEYQEFQALSHWFENNEQGNVLWFSPKYPGKHPGHKVILHQIAYDPTTMEKVLLHNALPFNCSHETLLNLVHSFFPNLETFDDPEKLRSILIEPDDNFLPEKLFTEIDKIDIKTPGDESTPDLSANELQRRATVVSKMMERGENSDKVVQQMIAFDLIGHQSISCPRTSNLPTFSELFTKNSETTSSEKTLECNCPFCGEHVKALIYNGEIHCPPPEGAPRGSNNKGCGASAPYKC